MRIDLLTVKPTWKRRALMFVIIPPAIVFTLIAEPVWAGLKVLGELLASFRELPHCLQTIWMGKRARMKKAGWFVVAGDPY